MIPLFNKEEILFFTAETVEAGRSMYVFGHVNACDRQAQYMYMYSVFQMTYSVDKRCLTRTTAHYFMILVPQISLFICRARCEKLSKLAVIWTNDRDVRGMGPFSNYVTNCFEMQNLYENRNAKQFVT